MLSRSALCPLGPQWVVWTHYLLLYPGLLNGQIPTKQTSCLSDDHYLLNPHCSDHTWDIPDMSLAHYER